MRAEHRDQRGADRHEPTAAEARLVSFAVFKELRVEAEARIDEKQSVIDQAHLYRNRRGTQQGMHRLPGLFGNAVKSWQNN